MILRLALEALLAIRIEGPTIVVVVVAVSKGGSGSPNLHKLA